MRINDHDVERSPMKLVSVNVSLPKTVRWGARSVRTGIYKEPVSGAVFLGRLNLEGDGQADPKYHGGVDKAIYAYPAEHYPFWQEALGKALRFGTFGENFTVEGMVEDSVRLGDIYELGGRSAHSGDAAAHAVREAGNEDGLDGLRPGVPEGRQAGLLPSRSPGRARRSRRSRRPRLLRSVAAHREGRLHRGLGTPGVPNL